jgi:hypothetical protein
MWSKILLLLVLTAIGLVSTTLADQQSEFRSREATESVGRHPAEFANDSTGQRGLRNIADGFRRFLGRLSSKDDATRKLTNDDNFSSLRRRTEDLLTLTADVSAQSEVVDSQVCRDSMESTFFVSIEYPNANCAWLASRPDQIAIVCNKEHTAYFYCPVTCGRFV